MPSSSSSVEVNADLQNERNKCSFNKEEFTLWWVGGEDQLRQKRSREKFFISQPEFQDEVPLHFASHKEVYEQSLRKATVIFTKVKKLLQDEGKYDAKNYVYHLDTLLGDGFIKEGNPLRVHFSMFVPAIQGHGSPEQQSQWLKPAMDCQMVGSYAQTELGHGTFLRGLETTATFDERTDEIVINSPTITAYKWWPGGLAQTVNYCIVMAQLYSNGKCHGIQPFLVPLRDLETHMPLPGIDIGDIGDKIGYKGVNNGYLGFKNIRIPRTNMLMKNAKLLRDGTFVKPVSSVLTYGTMVFVRVLIVKNMAQHLAKTATISVRYSCVRRQSCINPGQPEVQVIDHLTQQAKLLPLVAKSIALKLTADNVWDLYQNLQLALESNGGGLEQLSELHALICSLKAVSTTDTATGIEVCRLACGGHGYLSCSNFLTFYGVATASSTYEGENTVLYLQTARYLVKVWNQACGNKKLMPSVQYLADYATKPTAKRFPWSDSVPVVIAAFQAITSNKLRVACDHLEQRKKAGYTHEEAVNKTALELVRVAELHGRAFILSSTWEMIQKANQTASPQLVKVLRVLCELVVYDEALKATGDLLRFTTMSETDLIHLQRKYEEALSILRPDAVSIVDAFDYPDFVLGSALGAYDGNVYERLFEEAKKSPLNQEPVNKTFEMYLKPMMRRAKL
ncbi:probable peroxisomal acyl-coenzyme A oxidase 1 [Uranotaenia lowii]|uniref:probable peroxisomal acyl-coenzyme A oxidase 1 n=1 Tax=Uranotaenia lowii TaxID=190385 RepID=UPI00247A688A|nr:probable peroxisomal acyl-coenzyme A oxidase 1 [Uranotaenia lowii]